MTDPKLTGEMIKDMRDRASVTQAELAEKLGLAEGTLRNYERGSRVDKTDGPVVIPKMLDWALSAVANGLRPFSEIWLKKRGR